MAKVTRKGLLKTSTGALTIGALGAVPGVAAIAAARPEGTAGADLGARLAELKTAEPFMVFVSNPKAGEMTLIFGEQEIVVHDQALVARLWHARNGASHQQSAQSGQR